MSLYVNAAHIDIRLKTCYTWATSFQWCIFIILSAPLSSLAFQLIISPLWSALGPVHIRRQWEFPCRRLSLQFVDWRHQQAHMNQTQDFLAVEAKWNVVCLGSWPSLPLGLWPRWTVIKQRCAESALHISSASAFTLFLFMLLSGGVFFSLEISTICLFLYISLMVPGNVCLAARESWGWGGMRRLERREMKVMSEVKGTGACWWSENNL